MHCNRPLDINTRFFSVAWLWLWPASVVAQDDDVDAAVAVIKFRLLFVPLR